MFSAIEAERLIFTLIEPLEQVETVSLDGVSCVGWVLAAPVTSQLDFPHWDNSAMDGYAVRAGDVASAPTTLEVVEEIPAGKKPQKDLQPGQAARILTGAMMPAGADTVVMQEETTRESDRVTILQVPKPKSFVRHQGSFYRAGAELLTPGQLLAPPEVALLAAAQQTEVSVYRRPRVAILSTGSELIAPDQLMGPGQIVDSNQYALSAMVLRAGAVPLPLGIVRDERAAVKDAIAQALAQADMVISTGGVSVGDYDYIDDVLAELGAELHIRSVAVKPGKPLTVASFDCAQLPSFDCAQLSGIDSAQLQMQPQGRKLYFGLPGNPASAMVGFWRFVKGAIAQLSGRAAPYGPDFVWAKTMTALKAGGGRETYLWGQLTVGEQGYQFSRATGSHSSGNLVNLANTNGLGVVPQGETELMAGTSVRVLKID